jgi:membrane glycosyltransferase
MGGETLVKMVRLMQVEPRIGILQSAPLIVNASSLFARVQQFSNQLYGPMFSTGLAALQLGDASYWGHNAILRVAPFMRHCGLRRLKGLGLFKGSISSHDFVEGAYMARAGYEVWLEPALEQTYEESPPSLVDELSRDRRWAKGNLQHIALMLFGRRLRMAHRLAFFSGIMSYLASPLWFAFLVLITVEATKLILFPPDYFPRGPSLFPLWPEWNPEMALRMVGLTVFLLFTPKLLAAFDVLLMRRARQFGGVAAMLSSVLREIVLSSLLAPLRMLAHTRFVLEALFNIRLRWAGQNRTDETGWSDALRAHAAGSVVGASWAIFALWLKPMFFYWSLPIALPLVLAAPTSMWTSRISLGKRLRQRRRFLVAEEVSSLDLLQDLDHYQREKNASKRYEGKAPLVRALLEPRANHLHQTLAKHCAGGTSRQQHLAELRSKLLRKGSSALNTKELSAVMRDRDTLDWLHREIWLAAPDTYWGRMLHWRRRSGIERSADDIDHH